MNWKFLYLGIFLMPLLLSPWGADPFEVTKHAWLLVWLAAAVVVTAIILANKPIRIRHHRGVAFIVLLWLLSLTISTFLSPAPWEAFVGSAERMQGLFAMILYAAHFFICLQIFKEPRAQKVFFNLTIGIGAVLSGYAILQYFNLDPLDFADITDASGRAFATLGHPNFLGQLLIFPIMIILQKILENCFSKSFVQAPRLPAGRRGAGAHARRAWREGPQEKLFFSIFLLVLMFAALLTTLNRASILGIGLALGLFFITHHKISWKKILIGGSVLALITVALISTGGLRSILTRNVLIKSSLSLFIENPLFGSGPESFYQTIQSTLSPELYETERMFTLPDRVHNELLQTLLDQGLFGLTLYLIMIGFLIFLAIKRRLRSPAAKIAWVSLVAYLISVQFSFSMTPHWIFLVAMWAILINETITLKKKTIALQNPFAKATLLVVGTAISIVLIVRSITLVAADILFDQSIQEVIGENQSVKLEKTVKLNPWNREYLYHGISFLSTLPNPKEKTAVMEDFLQKLKNLTGPNFQYDLAAAEVETTKENLAAAEMHFVEASRQAPNWPYVDLLWGDFEYEHGGCEKASSHYERLIQLAPSYWNAPAGEKARIFRKGHQLFFDAVERLEECQNKR